MLQSPPESHHNFPLSTIGPYQATGGSPTSLPTSQPTPTPPLTGKLHAAIPSYASNSRLRPPAQRLRFTYESLARVIQLLLSIGGVIALHFTTSETKIVARNNLLRECFTIALLAEANSVMFTVACIFIHVQMVRTQKPYVVGRSIVGIELFIAVFLAVISIMIFSINRCGSELPNCKAYFVAASFGILQALMGIVLFWLNYRICKRRESVMTARMRRTRGRRAKKAKANIAPTFAP